MSGQGEKSSENFSIGLNKLYPKKTGKKERIEFKADKMYFNILREYQRRNDMSGSIQHTLRELIKEKHMHMMLEDVCKQRPEVLERLKECKNERDIFDLLYSKGMEKSMIDELGKIISSVQEMWRFECFRGRDRL